jgi:hypothetical protein
MLEIFEENARKDKEISICLYRLELSNNMANMVASATTDFFFFSPLFFFFYLGRPMHRLL